MSIPLVQSSGSAEGKSTSAVILLSLHVAAFLLIAAVLAPTEMELFVRISTLSIDIGLFLVLFAGLYSVLGIVWGLVPSQGAKFGLVLSAVAVPFLIILLFAIQALGLRWSGSGWFTVLSVVDALAIVFILVAPHILVPAPRAR